MNHTLEEPIINQSEFGPTLELLDPITILITNLPKQLLQKEVQTYQLLPSYWHNQGYAARLKMLNSLKRHASQIGIKLPDLGNLSFRMFKSSQVRGPGSAGPKNPEYNQNSERNAKVRNLNTKIYSNKQNNHSHVSGKYQIMHIGRWFLTPHQKRAVNYFMRKGKRMILGDGWNMGKTVTSLACMQYSKSKKVLIMTNKIFVSHWVWHIHQLLNSFSKNKGKIKIALEQPLKKQSNINKDCNTITIQILDYPQHSKNATSPYTYKAKEQGTKLQQKIIKQQHNITGNLYFTICSYEHMQNLVQQGIFSSCSSLTQIGFDIKSYNGVILDDLPNDISKGEQIDQSHYLMKISKIQNFIICKDTNIQNTLHYLPLLNSKLKWKQISDRYIGPKQVMVNLNEYASSLTKNYFYQTKETSCCPPGPFIKPILLSDQNKNHLIQKQPQDNITKSCFTKISPVCLYFNHIISQNKNITFSNKKQIDIFTVLDDYDLRQKFIYECKQKFFMSVKNLSDDSDFDDCSQKIDLTVGKIEEILKVLKTRKNKKPQKYSTKIILIQNRKNDPRINLYQNKINQLYNYGKLQYIQLCYEDSKTGQLKKVFMEGRKPKVTNYSFINQIISQGEYVNSDEQKQKPMPVNPQRYIDTGSDDQDLEQRINRNENDVSNIMIDENSEIEVEKRIGMSINIDEIEQIEIESRDRIIQLPNLLAVGKRKKILKQNDKFEILIDSDSEMIDEKCCEIVQDQHVNQVNINELNAPQSIEVVALENEKCIENNQISQVQKTESIHKTVEPQEILKRHGRKKLIKKPLEQDNFQKEANTKNIFKRETRQSARKNQKIDQAIVHDEIKSKPMKSVRRKSERKQNSNLSNQQNTLIQQKSHSLLVQCPQKVVLENISMCLTEQQTAEKQILEISSDDEEKTLVSVRPKKAKSKQVLSIKLVPNKTSLNYSNS